MDVYLPADFHALHDAAPDDWRDVSSSLRCADREPETQRSYGTPDSPNSCADPLWRVF